MVNRINEEIKKNKKHDIVNNNNIDIIKKSTIDWRRSSLTTNQISVISSDINFSQRTIDRFEIEFGVIIDIILCSYPYIAPLMKLYVGKSRTIVNIDKRYKKGKIRHNCVIQAQLEYISLIAYDKTSRYTLVEPFQLDIEAKPFGSGPFCRISFPRAVILNLSPPVLKTLVMITESFFSKIKQKRSRILIFEQNKDTSSISNNTNRTSDTETVKYFFNRMSVYCGGIWDYRQIPNYCQMIDRIYTIKNLSCHWLYYMNEGKNSINSYLPPNCETFTLNANRTDIQVADNSKLSENKIHHILSSNLKLSDSSNLKNLSDTSNLKNSDFNDCELTITSVVKQGRRVIIVDCPFRLVSHLSEAVQLFFLAEFASDWTCNLYPNETVALPLWVSEFCVSLIVKLKSESGHVWTASCGFKTPGVCSIISAGLNVSANRTLVCGLRCDMVNHGKLITLYEPVNLINCLPFKIIIHVRQLYPTRELSEILKPLEEIGLTLFDWNRNLDLSLDILDETAGETASKISKSSEMIHITLPKIHNETDDEGNLISSSKEACDIYNVTAGDRQLEIHVKFDGYVLSVVCMAKYWLYNYTSVELIYIPIIDGISEKIILKPCPTYINKNNHEKTKKIKLYSLNIFRFFENETVKNETAKNEKNENYGTPYVCSHEHSSFRLNSSEMGWSRVIRLEKSEKSADLKKCFTISGIGGGRLQRVMIGRKYHVSVEAIGVHIPYLNTYTNIINIKPCYVFINECNFDIEYRDNNNNIKILYNNTIEPLLIYSKKYYFKKIMRKNDILNCTYDGIWCDIINLYIKQDVYITLYTKNIYNYNKYFLNNNEYIIYDIICINRIEIDDIIYIKLYTIDINNIDNLSIYPAAEVPLFIIQNLSFFPVFLNQKNIIYKTVIEPMIKKPYALSSPFECQIIQVSVPSSIKLIYDSLNNNNIYKISDKLCDNNLNRHDLQIISNIPVNRLDKWSVKIKYKILCTLTRDNKKPLQTVSSSLDKNQTNDQLDDIFEHRKEIEFISNISIYLLNNCIFIKIYTEYDINYIGNYILYNNNINNIINSPININNIKNNKISKFQFSLNLSDLLIGISYGKKTNVCMDNNFTGKKTNVCMDNNFTGYIKRYINDPLIAPIAIRLTEIDIRSIISKTNISMANNTCIRLSISNFNLLSSSSPDISIIIHPLSVTDNRHLSVTDNRHLSVTDNRHLSVTDNRRNCHDLSDTLLSSSNIGQEIITNIICRNDVDDFIYIWIDIDLQSKIINISKFILSISPLTIQLDYTLIDQFSPLFIAFDEALLYTVPITPRGHNSFQHTVPITPRGHNSFQQGGVQGQGDSIYNPQGCSSSTRGENNMRNPLGVVSKIYGNGGKCHDLVSDMPLPICWLKCPKEDYSQKIFITYFWVQKIKVSLSVSKYLKVFSVHQADISSKSLQFYHKLITPAELKTIIWDNHFLPEFSQQWYRLLVSFDVVGRPISRVKRLWNGITQKIFLSNNSTNDQPLRAFANFFLQNRRN
eukprot:GHVL01042357.1.p1 GENE.GHVL01042357.1~~GHVL01042357.1.p1  ORF type:complete len:1505 (-),score=432.98 GHVL01042357.1:216-4730(-)